MSDYIDKEVKKIMEADGYPYPLNAAMATSWIMGNFKGINLKVLDVSEKSSLSDYFVIPSAVNIIQATSITSEIKRCFKNYDIKLISEEASEASGWILLDLGEVIVHVFLEGSRELYDIEGLWHEAKSIDIPQEYYFSSVEIPVAEDLDYF